MTKCKSCEYYKCDVIRLRNGNLRVENKCKVYPEVIFIGKLTDCCIKEDCLKYKRIKTK